ncbi:MAG: hypothetical protein SGI96_02385 [Bacteroidota bacterium]|nr:hypothetical protein [Bacteroidota bacterium]
MSPPSLSIMVMDQYQSLQSRLPACGRLALEYGLLHSTLRLANPSLISAGV